MKTTRLVVGRSLPRIDGVEKVTGRALFTADLVIPGMLFGAVLRSPLPHASITGIDPSRAAALPGVEAVLTRDDVTDLEPYFGHAIKDQPIVAIDRVRYVGDPVAAVAAADETTGRAALDLIEVEYEELPAVTDMDAALADGAPPMHGLGLALAAEGPDRADGAGNICHHERMAWGDADGALAGAAHVFDHTFTFPMLYHYAMEPHVAIAAVQGGRITVWTSAQHPFLVRAELAALFRRPLEQVRVIVPYIGGAFGSKSYTKIEPLAAALARKAGRPVRLALTVPEACLTTRRHAARIHLQTGVAADGHLVGRRCAIWLDTGAYADNGPRVAAKAARRVLGAYRCPNVRVDAYAVYTNTTPAGSFRSIGGPQATWANESQMDVIAEVLGLDPLEIRLRNLLAPGEALRQEERPVDADLAAGLRRVAAMIGWREPTAAGTGRGLALGVTDAGAEPVATAIIRMHHDGTVTLYESSTEIGQGVRTVLRQIAAEELALRPDRVGIVASDTAATPYDRSTGASRSTTLMGLAVAAACADLRRQLAEIASRRLGHPAASLAFEDGHIVASGAGSLTYGEAVQSRFGVTGGELVGRGAVGTIPERERRPLPVFWEISWGAAQVRVDEETGQVRLARYVSAADVGRAINPRLAEGQDEGAALMGVGHTLFEELRHEGGQLLNGNLIDYRVPLTTDLPDQFETVLIEAGNGPGPYGAKGMGEGAINPVAPAVASAVAQACGVRITDLPLTPERVWRALAARGRRAGIDQGEGKGETHGGAAAGRSVR